MGERSLIRPIYLLQSNLPTPFNPFDLLHLSKAKTCFLRTRIHAHTFTHIPHILHSFISIHTKQDGTHLRIHLRPFATFILSLTTPYPYPLNHYLTYLFRAMCRELECCSPRSPRQVRTLSRSRLGQSDACHWLIDPCSDSGFTASSS